MDEFQQAQEELGRGGGVIGWYDRLLPALTTEQRESLVAAGRNPAISHRAIVKVLERWGHPVTVGQVGHWRRNHVR